MSTLKATFVREERTALSKEDRYKLKSLFGCVTVHIGGKDLQVRDTCSKDELQKFIQTHRNGINAVNVTVNE